jgi:hypothetical protein
MQNQDDEIMSLFGGASKSVKKMKKPVKKKPSGKPVIKNKIFQKDFLNIKYLFRY